MNKAPVCSWSVSQDEIRSLHETVTTLLAPGGCPWSAEQDAATLVKWLQSECIEVTEAVTLLQRNRSDSAVNDLTSELGDVLFDALMLVLPPPATLKCAITDLAGSNL